MNEDKQNRSQGKPKGVQPPEPDPNREPGDEDLYNRDKQGNIFYDKNTEIRRETQFHDATASEIGTDEEKVNRENDLFRNQKEK